MSDMLWREIFQKVIPSKKKRFGIDTVIEK